jgi:hypothetical protein
VPTGEKPSTVRERVFPHSGMNRQAAHHKEFLSHAHGRAHSEPDYLKGVMVDS